MSALVSYIDVSTIKPGRLILTDTPPKRSNTRKLVEIAGAILSFTAGLVVGPYASELITRSNPGFFGPDNQTIIDEQQANFATLDAKFNELMRTVPKDAKTAGLATELSKLLAKQQALAARKDRLFRAVDNDNQDLKTQLLRKQGLSGAVDFWAKPGESYVLKDRDKVFSVVAVHSHNRIDVNLSGERKRMNIGDPLEFESSAGKCTVFYRQGKRETDGRVGFDLTCEEPDAR